MSFYCTTKEKRNEWIDHLKNISILSNIKAIYRIESKLGKGSFGKVYLATMKINGKKYAIKSINKKILYKKPKNVLCLAREIKIMRLLNHPNIVKLYEVYESQEHVCLVMEYVEGGDLMMHLKNKGTYSEKDTSLFIMQILQILDYCHSLNIVHRDLKPENLMITYILRKFIGILITQQM